MPHRRHRLKRLLSRFRTGDLLAVECSRTRPTVGIRSTTPRARAERVRRRFGGHRMAASLTFAVLFFAGAAFTAGAGDMLAEAVDTPRRFRPHRPRPRPRNPNRPQIRALTECPARLREFEPEECAKLEAGRGSRRGRARRGCSRAARPGRTERGGSGSRGRAARRGTVRSRRPPKRPLIYGRWGRRPTAPKAPNPGLAAQAGRAHEKQPAAAPAGKPVLATKPHREHHESGHVPESGAPEFGTMWLDRDLPDPTPPSRRLTRKFARDLKAASRQAHVRWTDVLAVLRARGDRSQAPAGRKGLDALASRLAELGARDDSWGAFLALEGRTSFADRALALAHYHRAVGLPRSCAGSSGRSRAWSSAS